MLPLAFATLLASAACAHAQGFRAVASKDGVEVWCAGDSGRVWRSLDGGAHFEGLNFGTRTLHAITVRGFSVIAAGDSGRIWRSGDAGATVGTSVIAGAPTIRALLRTSATRAFLCGDGGRMLRSDDDGLSWSPLPSGTTATLRALAFADGTRGWACGDGGTLLRTSDGGASWSAVALGTTRTLYSLAALGNDVWVGGAAGTLFHSSDGGASFASVGTLGWDMAGDVRGIALELGGVVTLAGAGGALSRSSDGGATWSFGRHPLHTPLSAVCAAGGTAFAVGEKQRAPLHRTAPDAWALPDGATVTRTWQKVRATPSNATNVRGCTVAVNPLDRRVLYVLLGATLYRSPDDGDTWVLASTISAVNRANMLLISPRDTTRMLAACVSDGGTREVVRSIDGGSAWSTPLVHAFGEYGTPLEMHPDHPDTVYFGGENDELLRSTDFGVHWSQVGTTRFRSPCDLFAVPGTNTLVVADGVTGSDTARVWVSDDDGDTFVQRGLGSASEMPALAGSRQRIGRLFATSWSGVGARTSADTARTWPLLPDMNRVGQNVAQTWGVDVAHDDPNVVWIGTYSGAIAWVSLDGGVTFAPSPLTNSNYGMFVRDRATAFAEQADGLYKLRTSVNVPLGFAPQSVLLTSPNGGETLLPGTTLSVEWSATSIARARLEWRVDPLAPWQDVAFVEGYAGHYDWVVPEQYTSTASMRISDADDVAPSDESDDVFTIAGAVGVGTGTAPRFALAPLAPQPVRAGGTLHVRFALAARGAAALELFGLRGERIATLADGVLEAGDHDAAFTLDRALPPGMCFVRLRAGGREAVRRVVVVR